MSTFVDDVQHQPAATTKRETSTAAPTPSSTSPEANGSGNVGDLAPDGYPKDLDIPVRYVKGMGGDMDEARRRWIDTLKGVVSTCKRCAHVNDASIRDGTLSLVQRFGEKSTVGRYKWIKGAMYFNGHQWKEAEKVDTILEEPVPSFDIIKQYYPHFYFKQAKNGCYVYYEIPGRISLTKLKENGLDMDALCRHYVYITEFLWKELDKNPEGKLLTCMDMKGARLSMFAGEVKEFLLRSAKMIGAHYPERSFKIFILNAPWWFTVVWKFVSPFVHPNTKAKVVVCGSNFLPQLGELIDLDNVPQEIGGLDATSPLQGPEEVKMREHVMKVLKDNGVEMKPVR